MSRHNASKGEEFDIVDDLKIHKVGGSVRITPLDGSNAEFYIGDEEVEEFASVILEHAKN